MSSYTRTKKWAFDSPCVQDAFIGLKLLHEAFVGSDAAATFFDIVKCFVQRPAVFLHQEGHHLSPNSGHRVYSGHVAAFITAMGLLWALRCVHYSQGLLWALRYVHYSQGLIWAIHCVRYSQGLLWALCSVHYSQGLF